PSAAFSTTPQSARRRPLRAPGNDASAPASGIRVFPNQSVLSCGKRTLQSSITVLTSSSPSANHSALTVWLWPPSCRYSAQACPDICVDEVGNIPAITAATARSGHAVEVAHTPRTPTPPALNRARRSIPGAFCSSLRPTTSCGAHSAPPADVVG